MSRSGQNDRLLAESLRNEEENNLREAAAQLDAAKDKGEAARCLKKMMRAAFKMLVYAPERSQEVKSLICDLTSAASRKVDSQARGSEPESPDELGRRYEQFSAERKDAFLESWKDELERGLSFPSVKPSLLGIGPERFIGSDDTLERILLPEFCSISLNILDCFATALLSAPDLEFSKKPVMLKCRLHEDRNDLIICLSATFTNGQEILPLEWTQDSEVWIARRLRPLAKTKGIPLETIYWDRSGLHSIFFFDYPGHMIRDKVPGLGTAGEDGIPQWPQYELRLDHITAPLRQAAKYAIDFVESDPESAVQ